MAESQNLYGAPAGHAPISPICGEVRVTSQRKETLTISELNGKSCLQAEGMTETLCTSHKQASKEQLENMRKHDDVHVAVAHATEIHREEMWEVFSKIKQSEPGLLIKLAKMAVGCRDSPVTERWRDVGRYGHVDSTRTDICQAPSRIFSGWANAERVLRRTAFASTRCLHRKTFRKCRRWKQPWWRP